MNAKFDYVVGTSTTKMVNSFTQTVRNLYNGGVKDVSSDDILEQFPLGVGYAGAISKPILEENSDYSGYHIVLFTGTLNNVDSKSITTENVFKKLSGKTSVSYGETLFEYFYEKCANIAYNKYESNLLSSIKAKSYYNENNYSDMYE